jgi:hypothetical protein
MDSLRLIAIGLTIIAGRKIGILAAGAGQITGRSVDAAMCESSFNCVRTLRPLALNPFEIRKTWAVLILVDHARRQ